MGWSGAGFWRRVSVEPLMFLHSLGIFALEPLAESLVVDKTCLVTFNMTWDVCRDLASHPDLELKVQQEASKVQGISTLLANFLPVLLLMYLGPLSDRFGRKPFLYYNLVMEVLSDVVYLVCALVPRSPAYLTLVAPFLYSCGAAMGGFQMLLFASIADVSSVEDRTFRLGLLKLSMVSAEPLGRILGGQVYAAWGYVTTFGVGLVLVALCLLYTAIMPEPAKPDTTKEVSVRWAWQMPRDLLGAVVRRDGPRRTLVFLNLFSFSLSFFGGDKPPYFIFFKHMLGWDAADYSNWLFYMDSLQVLAMLLTMWALGRHVDIPDAGLGILGTGARTLKMALLGLLISPSLSWLAVLAPVMGMFELLGQLSARSIISKCSSGGTELGKLFAAQGVLISLLLAASGPMYGAIYSATVDALPTTMFLVAGYICFGAVIGFRVMDGVMRRWEAHTAHSTDNSSTGSSSSDSSSSDSSSSDSSSSDNSSTGSSSSGSSSNSSSNSNSDTSNDSNSGTRSVSSRSDTSSCSD